MSQDGDLPHLLATFLDDVQSLVKEDERVAALVRNLGEILVRIGSQADPVQANEKILFDAVQDDVAISLGTDSSTPIVGPTSLDTTITDPPVVSARPIWRSEAPALSTRDDLVATEARCRIKLQAAIWTIERGKLLVADADVSADITAQGNMLITQAKQIGDCYLWMLERTASVESLYDKFVLLSGCYTATAEAIKLVCDALDVPTCPTDTMRETLQFVAEAQSALRTCVQSFDRVASDYDQTRLFFWLKTYRQEHQFLLDRFMRLSDAANPENWGDLCDRIQVAREGIRTLAERIRNRKRLLNKLRYHQKLIHDNPRDERLHDWRKVCEATDDLIAGGLPPSAVELREMLLPVLDYLPRSIELSSSMQRVLVHIDTYASTPTNVASLNSPQENAVLAEARLLLAGRSIVLIGGERRPVAEAHIASALGVRNLFWIDTRSHQTHIVFEPYIARPDVVVVLLAIRWASHGFGEMQAFCERYSKLLVRLPAGYNVNQIAHQIVHQAGDTLRRLPTEALLS